MTDIIHIEIKDEVLERDQCFKYLDLAHSQIKRDLGNKNYLNIPAYMREYQALIKDIIKRS